MAKDSDYDDSTAESSGDSDLDYDAPAGASVSMGRSRRGRSSMSMVQKRPAKTTAHKIPEIARVLSTATDTVDDATDAEERLAAVDQAVLSKIRKSLNLAQHQATGEAEAKAALKMASILMKRINITQADLMAQESASEKAKRGGQSVVSVLSNPEYKRGKGQKAKQVQIKNWQITAVSAVEEFFDVKTYSSQYDADEDDGREAAVEWTFYGIAENTTTAAHAFEMVHNTIMTWSYEQPTLKGQVMLNSYRSGVAMGLLKTAQGEKKAEEQRTLEHEKKLILEKVKQEEAARERELQRLRGPVEHGAGVAQPRALKVEDLPITQEPMHQGVKLEEVEDEDRFHHPNPFDAMEEDDDGYNRGGFDSDDDDALDVDAVLAPDFAADNINDAGNAMPIVAPAPVVKVEDPPAIKKEESPAPDQWQSMGQLTRFRKDAETIADDYLKSTKIKFATRRKRKPTKIDSHAYQRGREDSKKIDVKRRRLEGGAKCEADD